MQNVPYTDIEIDEFGTVHYTDFMGVEHSDKGRSNKKGYKMIKIRHNKYYYVHRLVARVFVENPAPTYFCVVHHKDHDRSNNQASNLEWTTRQLNNAQKIKMRLTKQTKTGYRVKFIFDQVVRNWFKIFPTKEDAYAAGLIKKQELVNAKRAHIISCEKTGKNINEQLCLTCGITAHHTRF
jgi:hypothetical protein